MFSILKKIFLLIFFLIVFLENCSKEEPIKNFQNTSINYGKLCRKIQDCYSSYYRTIPPELQEKLSLSNCRDKFKIDFGKKLPLLPLEDLSLFESCYNSMMEAPCKKFTVVSLADPSCAILQKKYNEEKDDSDEQKKIVKKKIVRKKKK